MSRVGALPTFGGSNPLWNHSVAARTGPADIKIKDRRRLSDGGQTRVGSGSMA